METPEVRRRYGGRAGPANRVIWLSAAQSARPLPLCPTGGLIPPLSTWASGQPVGEAKAYRPTSHQPISSRKFLLCSVHLADGTQLKGLAVRLNEREKAALLEAFGTAKEPTIPELLKRRTKTNQDSAA